MKKTLQLGLSIFLLFQVTVSNAGNSPAPIIRLSKSNNTRNAHHAVGGNGFAIEIRNGQLWAFGTNTFGQLGDGSGVQQNLPVQVGNDNNWVDINTGYEHALALKADGTLWSWGRNQFGQLGIGTIPQQNTPVQVGTDNDWVSIGCGAYHSFAIKSNGTLWAWGRNQNGQLGIANTNTMLVPVQVGTFHNWLNAGGGFSSSAGLQADGSLWTWGDNSLGQLGNNNLTLTQALVPIHIGTARWKSIECGQFYVMGLQAPGSLWGWGSNNNGQLGDGTITTIQPFPKRVSNAKWVGMSCSQSGTIVKSHTLGIQADGSLWAWGDNSVGQLGNGAISPTPTVSPIQILPSSFNIVNVECGWQSSYARAANGQLFAWGNNNTGNLGNNTITNLPSPTQVSVIPLGWSNLSCGDGYTAAVKSDGTLWTWGDNSSGQLGNGTLTPTMTTNPAQAGTATNWITAVAGKNHGLALRADGTLYAWGDDSFGQLGNGTPSPTAFPTPQIIGSTLPWIAVSAGDFFSFAIKADGTLWAWGKNSSSQLGNGSSVDLFTPTQIGTDTTWVDVECGSASTLALKSDGTLWSWGDNSFGRLGLGSSVPVISTPQLVTGFNNWVCIANSAGGGHVIGVQANGTLWAWGDNSFGQLGIGNNSNTPLHNSPVQVGTETDWVFASAGAAHTFALKANGSPWSWGDNTFGQIGVGFFDNTPPVYGPLQIFSVHSFQATFDLAMMVSCGYNHTGVIKPDRSRICMVGSNLTGQLGDGASGLSNNKNLFECVVYAPPCTAPSLPVLSATATTVCAGTTVNLSVASGNLNSALDWQWYTGSCGGTPVGAGTVITEVPSATTTYYVRGEGGCVIASSCSSIVITVNPLPVISANASLSNVCAGTNVTLSGTGGVSYSWTGGASNGVPFTPTLTATYTVTGTDGNGCTGTASTAVAVTQPNVTPTALNTSATVVCILSNTVTLTQSGGTLGTGAVWKWYSDSGFTILQGTATSANALLIVTPTVTTTYYLRAEDALSPCAAITAATGSVTITVTNAAPIRPSVVTGPQNLCPLVFSSGTYTATAVSGATSYKWTLLPGMTSVGTNTLTIVSNTVTTTNNFVTVSLDQNNFVNGVIMVVASNACGDSPSQQSLSLTLLPATPGTITGPVTVCFSVPTNVVYTTTSAIASAYGVALPYDWTVPNGMSITGGLGTSAITVAVTPNTPISGDVTVLTNNPCGSATALATKTVTSAAGTLGAIGGNGGNDNICTNIASATPATFTIAPIAGATSYTWTAPAGASILSGNGSTAVSVMFTNTYASKAQLTVKASNGCKNTANVYKWLYKIPETPATITVTGATCTSGAVFSIPAVNGAVSYNWTVPAGLTLVSGQGSNSITTSKTGAIAGNVSVAAINSCGTSAARILTVSCASSLFVQPGGFVTNLYPNPAKAEFTIEIDDQQLTTNNQQLTIEMYDVLGNMVMTKKHTIIAGNNAIKTNVEGMKKGIYFVRIVDAENRLIYAKALIKD